METYNLSDPPNYLADSTDTLNSKQVTAIPISIKSDSGKW